LIAFIIYFFFCGAAFRSKKNKKRSGPTGEHPDDAHISAPGSYESHNDADTATEEVEMGDANK